MPALPRAFVLLLLAMSCIRVTAAPVPLKAEPFPLDRVRLLDGPFKARQDVNARYLLEIVEPDRLLAGFRAQAGLPEKAKRYGGWEARGINGHSLGHYLSALSALYASTGDPRAKARIDFIVTELAACQAANGDGYVLPVDKRIYEDLRAGRIKASGFSLNNEWVPNYTLHKVFAGLRDAYRFAGNKQALEVERRLSDYLAGVYQNLTPAQAQEILKSEFGGLNEVFADLTTDTGDPRYLKLAGTVFHHDAIINPLEAGRDELDGKHGNTQVPKLVGLAREYLLTGDPAALTGIHTFWDSVVNTRSFANGGHGDHEHFFPPRQFPQKLGPQDAETCNSYNMIKLTGLMFSWDPQAADMDFVERGLINHVLTNIGREPGEFGYFLPFGSIAYKTFSTTADSWWCCVGTGMENPARYGEQVYFHHDDTLWVNLYLASRLDWRERDVALRQETAFPDGDTVRLVIEAKRPTRLTLKLRHPYWCQQPEVSINGKAVTVNSMPSSYFELSREWRDGDTVVLRLPMTLRTEPLPHSDGKIVALMYGPLQLVAVVPTLPSQPDPARQRYGDHLKSPGLITGQAPVLVAADKTSLLASFRPDPSGQFAAFRSAGVMQPADLSLVPFHRIYQEHYTAYFAFFTPSEWQQRQASLQVEQAAREALEAATLDRVEPGFQQSEVEHKFASDRSETGDFRDRKWRDALPGGWFSYQLTVDPAKPMALVSTYWSDDRGREFELQIDGHTLAVAKPALSKRSVFFEAAYAIPAELTRGKTSVTVRLVATKGRVGTFGFRTLIAGSVTADQWAAGQR
jgi:uncharacterized protein